jgi:hypothetical protein
MAYVVEHMPSKCKFLSSNPIIPPPKEKGKKKKLGVCAHACNPRYLGD